MARHDVSHELRDREGKWTRGGAALHRMAQEAIDAQSPEAVLAKVRAIEPGGGKNINGHWVDRPSSEDHKYRVKLKTSDRGKRDAKVYASPEEAARAVSAGTHGPTTEAGPGSPPLAPPRREVPPSLEDVFRKGIAPPSSGVKVHHPKSLELKVQASVEDKKRMRQQILKATTKQAEITPDLVERTDITITRAPHGERGTLTLASHTGRLNTLHVKPEVLIGDNAQAVLEYNRKAGWWVPTDHQHDLSMNVNTHEFGHGTHGELNRLGVMKANRNNATIYEEDEQEFWRGLAKAIGARVPRTGFKDSSGQPGMNVVHWHSENKEVISTNIGRYASHSMNEMIAELWTEYRLSSNPRPPAKYFGDWATKHLQLHEQLIA